MDSHQKGQSGGFFGIGKFVVFAGTDHVKLLERNSAGAYEYTFRVDKVTGDPFLIKVRDISNSQYKKGVTIRRIKDIVTTIPAIDQMIAQGNWRVFAGMASGEKNAEGKDFTISFIKMNDKTGKEEQVKLEVRGKQMVAETEMVMRFCLKPEKITRMGQ